MRRCARMCRLFLCGLWLTLAWQIRSKSANTQNLRARTLKKRGLRLGSQEQRQPDSVEYSVPSPVNSWRIEKPTHPNYSAVRCNRHVATGEWRTESVQLSSLSENSPSANRAFLFALARGRYGRG